MVDHETPPEELEKQWEETLGGIFMDKTTYTIGEVADLLNCHKDTVRRAIKAGALKAVKLGKDYRVSKPDLEEWWKQRGGGTLFPDEGGE